MDNSLLHRKESLILTTIDVMSELGIQGLSTREIAKRQGVSEATLFRHYKSKTDLLLAVLDYYSKYDGDIAKSIELKGLTPLAAIEFWVNSYIEYYENYPAITAICQSYDTLTYDVVLAEKVKDIFHYRYNVLKGFIDQAKEEEEIKKNTDSEHLTGIIFGFIKLNCLKWRLSDFAFSLKDTTMEALSMVLNAFKI